MSILKDFLAAYPFSERAKQALSTQGINEVSGRELESARAKVNDIVRGAYDFLPLTGIEEARSYAVCKMLISVTGMHSVARKFAKYHAKKSGQSLLESEDEEIMEVAREFFPSVKKENNEFCISIPDLLKNGGELANAQVESGKAYYSKEGLALILQEAIERKISEIRQVNANSIATEIRDAALELEASLPKEEIKVFSFKGALLQQACMQKVISGISEGHRFHGSMALSIACLKDGLTLEKASEVLKSYVANCRGTHSFTEEEALASLQWVYKHPNIGFSCKLMLDQGLISERCSDCPFKGGKNARK